MAPAQRWLLLWAGGAVACASACAARSETEPCACHAADCACPAPCDPAAGDPGGADPLPGDPAPSCVPGSFVTTIAANADDGEIELGFDPEWFPSGEGAAGTNYAGYNLSVHHGPVWVFLRFPLTTAIPADATVTSATLRLWGTATYVWDAGTEALRIRIETSADARQIDGRADAPELPSTGRNLSLNAVRWPASGGLAWTVPGWNTAPDLGGLIQELVAAHGGLAAGAYVQLWLDGDFEDQDGEVGIEDFAHPDPHHPELTLAWTCS